MPFLMSILTFIQLGGGEKAISTQKSVDEKKNLKQNVTFERVFFASGTHSVGWLVDGGSNWWYKKKTANWCFREKNVLFDLTVCVCLCNDNKTKQKTLMEIDHLYDQIIIIISVTKMDHHDFLTVENKVNK